MEDLGSIERAANLHDGSIPGGKAMTRCITLDPATPGLASGTSNDQHLSHSVLAEMEARMSVACPSEKNFIPDHCGLLHCELNVSRPRNTSEKDITNFWWRTSGSGASEMFIPPFQLLNSILLSNIPQQAIPSVCTSSRHP